MSSWKTVCDISPCFKCQQIYCRDIYVLFEIGISGSLKGHFILLSVFASSLMFVVKNIGINLRHVENSL